jgi:hypothetical protein
MRRTPAPTFTAADRSVLLPVNFQRGFEDSEYGTPDNADAAARLAATAREH